MPMVKKYRFDVTKGKLEEFEEEEELKDIPVEGIGIDLSDLEKLIKYAKSKGWI